MKSGLILENNDVKKIIAEQFNVDESCVVKSQYTWTVVTGETDRKKEDWERYLEMKELKERQDVSDQALQDAILMIMEG